MALTVDAILGGDQDLETIEHATIAGVALFHLAERFQERERLDDEQLEDGLAAAGANG
jgi:hypothetical protein